MTDAELLTRLRDLHEQVRALSVTLLEDKEEDHSVVFGALTGCAAILAMLSVNEDDEEEEANQAVLDALVAQGMLEVVDDEDES